MKVFGFVKKVFFVGLKILSSFTNASSLSCISVNNQVRKAIPQIVNVNGIKVRVFFGKNIEKKHLCHHDKNYCYFYK